VAVDEEKKRVDHLALGDLRVPASDTGMRGVVSLTATGRR
jgi:hypothetical protein